jgi:hypothetical protein
MSHETKDFSETEVGYEDPKFEGFDPIGGFKCKAPSMTLCRRYNIDGCIVYPSDKWRFVSTTKSSG